jgi:hypothetical protein
LGIQDALNQGFDLTNIIHQGAGNAPLWAIGLFLIRIWVNGRKKAEKAQKEAMASVQDKLNRIEIALAESGIKDLKENIEKLKEAKTKSEMNIDALWRTVDKSKRPSDV